MSTSAASSKLFEPVQIGKNKLAHRIALAPLTRFRCDADHVPLDMVNEYYNQRAQVPGTLLITEATILAPQAAGYPGVPHIHSKEQIAAWKKITDSVHAKGSFIYCQIWALGRAADPSYLKAQGRDVISSGDLPFEGGAKPRALSEDEIKEFIQLYAQAAKNAIEAGFDGVEIHGANGYLIDQFTQNTCNNRTDSWGGSVENRCRFAIEVTKAVVAAVGKERTSIRLSPYSSFQGMKMEKKDLEETFTYLVGELKKQELVYLHMTEARIDGNADHPDTTDNLNWLIKIWDHTSPIVVAGGYTGESAVKALNEQYKDYDVVIAFGRYFISNPDLVKRVQEGKEFRPYDRNLFYNAGEAKGYTEYEAHAPEFKF